MPLFKFGVVADPQYAPVAPEGTRFYSNSLSKMSAALAAFESESVQFTVSMGDIVERHWESYHHILPLYDRLNCPHHFVLGNHDYTVAPEYLRSVRRGLGMPAAYYDFVVSGFRFIILDGNDVSTFAPPVGDPRRALADVRLAALKLAGAPNAFDWNGSLSDAQFTWLQQRVALASTNGERAIIMIHYPIHPMTIFNLWDCQRVRDLIVNSPSVVACLSGHNHSGDYATLSGKHFLTFAGMVETSDQNAYAIVDVSANKMDIRGFGRETTRTLTF